MPILQHKYHIVRDQHGAALCGGGAHDGLRLDFDDARVNAGVDPLVKAIGTRAKTVVDATAGWGNDAVHLARAGYVVTAVEKHDLVAAMLQHAYADCDDVALKARLTIVHGDSVALLHTITPAPDVIYLDPMYAPKSNSAAVKKQIAVLQTLVASDEDADLALFEQAMTCATQRVVVKRARRACALHAGKVGEICGKLVRFDMYKPNSSG